MLKLPDQCIQIALRSIQLEPEITADLFSLCRTHYKTYLGEESATLMDDTFLGYRMNV